VATATIDVPDALVEARAKELWDSMLHQLSHQGIDRETYLRISGRSEEEMLEAVAEASPPGDKTSPAKLLERLRDNGRLDSLKDDLSQRKALDLLAESAKPVPTAEQPDS
jgi:trigger factor